MTACSVVVLVAGACAPEGRYPLPSTPVPVPWADTLPIMEPAEAPDYGIDERLKEVLTDQPGHALGLARRISGTPPALNVDAFDEVVPSTWFQPRITHGPLTRTDVTRGPPLAGPDTDHPLRVVSGKVEGVTSGLTVEDRSGTRFLLKFDPPGMSGLGSGADAVSSRIFWAAGYNVPKDMVISVERSDLKLADRAEIDTGDGTRPMTPEDVDAALSSTEAGPDGSIRMLASRFVEGTPKGPFRFEGRRSDDPNDHYPHEDRRELRGIWVLASWVNHVDLRPQNTLDSYLEPGYHLRHYLIDFATTLGSGAIRYLNPREGREYAFDATAIMGRLLTVGLYRVGWEGIDGAPLHPAIGWLPSDSFEPEAWKPFIPNEAFRRMTARDGYWGAKLVAAFDEAHVWAAVEAGAYPAEASSILHDVLMERRRRILVHWFGQVTPVEAVTVLRDGSNLHVDFEDLGLSHNLWSSEQTSYGWRLDDTSGSVEARASGSGEQSIRIPLADDLARRLDVAGPDSPVTLELIAVRSGSASRPVHIRLVADVGDAIVVTGRIH